MQDFCHLHVHSQYSLLDGASDIETLMIKAKNDKQVAVALTDHGNMFGAFKFVKSAKDHGLKPIVGCEFYLVPDRFVKTFEKSKGQKDERYHQLLLAKNEIGYKNLTKLCSLGYKEGMYGKYPRIDKELLMQYHEGLIATSCCVGAEIPQAIAHGYPDKAEKLLKWWIDLFGEDYYIEIQRQKGMDKIDGSFLSLEQINQELIKLAHKYHLKIIATNDVHYVEQEDSDSHDVLLCVNTGGLLKDTDRFKFPSNDFYFKTKEEMNAVFSDLPMALDNTMEIVAKVKELDLKRDVLLPAFPLPQNFLKQDDYLKHLTFEGAKRRWGSISAQIEERLNFELMTIANSGYPGYFLIVQDFTTAARNMGVSVGPGRGSAAGSAVAYCLGITNIDPIKYDLLFERFLNPERVSMPDIDIDFDDNGRDKVINYVIDKYGRDQVAQIVTYGTMAARTSLRDTGRVMDIPLSVVDQVAKSFPENLGATLNKVLADDDINPKLKSALGKEDLDRAYKFRELSMKEDEIGVMIRTAKKIEGSVRSTGVHACGVIITPEDVSNLVPVATAKDSDIMVSQFDNSVAESAGLLKMDFLGLKTLSIIKAATDLVIETLNVDIQIDDVDLTDFKTFELFGRGDTVGIFQFESPGMQKHLKDLKPDKFEDLIAMNALYRPGPLQYIGDFIQRKHGRKEIKYDLPEMEEYLDDTYGITVYQEQVMLLSQKLAGFTKGEADTLRKGMGKKDKKLIDKLYPKFIEGCKSNGLDEEKVKKVWKDWEAFAEYAFNKSHSTCYAFLAFQTAYLKAHYPMHFMTAVLNHNKGSVETINFFMEEASRLGIKILGPDINESNLDFSISNNQYIRFGLSAVKGVGEGPVSELTAERSKKPFVSAFDIVKRCNLRAVNKKCLDSLAYAGAFDSFGMPRAAYFTPGGGYDTFIEHLLKFGSAFQSQKVSSQASLFGDMTDSLVIEPIFPQVEEWQSLQKLEYEKVVTGFYLSGHPLDQYKLEFTYFINTSLDQIDSKKDVSVTVGGIVSDVRILPTKRGTNYARFTLTDYTTSKEFSIFTEQFEKFKHLLTIGNVLAIDGIYQKPYNQDQLQFRVKDIALAETIAKQKTKSITVKLQLLNINAAMIAGLFDLVKSHKGDHSIKFIVQDGELDDSLDLNTKKYKVNANYDFISGLDDLNLQYKLN